MNRADMVIAAAGKMMGGGVRFYARTDEVGFISVYRSFDQQIVYNLPGHLPYSSRTIRELCFATSYLAVSGFFYWEIKDLLENRANIWFVDGNGDPKQIARYDLPVASSLQTLFTELYGGKYPDRNAMVIGVISLED